MARTESPLVTRGVQLLREGGHTLRGVAALLGVSPSTLTRAAARAGLVLPRGRPKRSAHPAKPA